MTHKWPFFDHFWSFLTAISHRGLRNDFFFFHFFSIPIYFFQFLYGLFCPIYIWTFLSFFHLEFYFPFLFGLLFPFSNWTFRFISFQLVSTRFNSFQLVSTRFNSFQLNRGLILDFFQIFC